MAKETVTEKVDQLGRWVHRIDGKISKLERQSSCKHETIWVNLEDRWIRGAECRDCGISILGEMSLDRTYSARRIYEYIKTKFKD